MDDYFAGSGPRPQTGAPPQYPPARFPPAQFPPSPVPAQSAPPAHQTPFAPPQEQPPAYAPAGWGPPAATPAPQTGYPPYPQAWGQPYAPPARKGPNTAMIAVLVGVAVFVGIAFLAAIAIPVFLNQRDLAERTAVAAPETLLGMPRLTDPVSTAAAKQVLMESGPGSHVSGVYGIGESRIIVGASKHAMSASDEEQFLAGAVSEAQTQGVTLQDVEPGALGGTMRCGESTQLPMTLCFFVDAGSYGIVGVVGSDDATSTATSAREAFVHRT